ncbi:hypothetical protein [Legionella antarctica]|uniref:hypothetical protein n=1 Tax=Legionella antarctica TaxID=2708020 RepID=UPI001D01E02B|nr:hypothetical protein [Legionella antarctica]
MKKILSTFLMLCLHLHASASSSDFTLCKSTYALCTTAVCQPLPGKAGFATCACKVKTGYSAGTKPCTGIIKTKAGKAVSSRYFPIKAYKNCANDRLWAFCLDSPCVVNPNDSSKASCICSLVKNKGNYVIVSDGRHKTSCTSKIYSSATVNDVTQITAFLKTHSELPPFPIKELNGH